MNAWSLVVFCATVAVVLYLVIAEPAVTIPAKWLRRRQPLRIKLRCACVCPTTLCMDDATEIAP